MIASSSTRIALGTAQFGMDYGATNNSGQVSPSEVSRILSLAKASGVTALDTASIYGESEQVLGSADTGEFSIVTKLAPVSLGTTVDASWVVGEATNSLTKLKRTKLTGLLVHKPEDLRGPNGKEVIRGLKLVKDSGLTDKIGVSIYDPGDLLWISQLLDLDIVQAPLNVFDRRMLDTGWLHTLNENGVEVHVRSVFLQGSLTTDAAKLPGFLQPWSGKFIEFADWSESLGLSLLEAAILFPLSIKEAAKVIVGVLTANHLEEILRASKGKIPSFPDFKASDPRLINPVNWCG